MFLEPDPKGRQKKSDSGFFSSQRPIASPRDFSSTGRRKYLPFNERSPSEVNEGGSTPPKPTVRLVKPSPEPRTERESDDKENVRLQEDVADLSSSPTTSLVPDAQKPGSARSTHGYGSRVSDVHAPTNEVHILSRSGRDNLFSTNTASIAAWHRRSGSSNLSTLRGESVYGPKSVRTESRASQGTTLRGTPTPSEIEHAERISAEEDSSQLSLRALHGSRQTSADPSTVRIVSTPPESVCGDDWIGSSPISVLRPSSSPTGSYPRASSRRTSSTSSLPTPRQLSGSPSTSRPDSQASIERSETLLSDSSPNFVAYYSSPPNQARRYRLYNATSIESIQARLESPQDHRPETGHSITTTKSLGSPPPSVDTPPPLVIPKKRLRHKPASSALHADAAASAAMADEDYDTQPYPRQPFNTHLSTIASESDARSQAASQQDSHFSLGSGVLTGDDASISPSASSPRQGNAESSQGGWSSDVASSGSRSETAWPQPLFQPPGAVHQRYGVPLPPVPGSPSSEDFDTIGELTAPRLREQRSGYSLRHKSHSTSSRSRSHSRPWSQASEASRWSQGTVIFPTWAKAYYAYGATLMSSSQISLSTPVDAQRIQNIQQYMYNRDWSERSTVSRLGSEVSDVEPMSPVSNRYLPSIWRPRTRKKSATGRVQKKARRSTPRPSISADSMVISQAAVPQGPRDMPEPVQPEYYAVEQPQSLLKRYSKQRQWSNMSFPRPMSKDELSEFPSLRHTKRREQRVSAWRAPSFAESLDTLLRSRCNRQILFFAVGFVCPLLWMVASFLPLPKKPMSEEEFTRASRMVSEENVQVAMMKHEAGDAQQRWREEREWLKARWWRYLNRIMSVIGVLFLAAVISLAVVATRM